MANGCFVAADQIFEKSLLEKTIEITASLVEFLVSSYDDDGVANEFTDFDMEAWDILDIVRAPRINPGKHNIHLAEFSSTHSALSSLVSESIVLYTLETSYVTTRGSKKQ